MNFRSPGPMSSAVKTHPRALASFLHVPRSFTTTQLRWLIVDLVWCRTVCHRPWVHPSLYQDPWQHSSRTPSLPRSPQGTVFPHLCLPRNHMQVSTHWSLFRHFQSLAGSPPTKPPQQTMKFLPDKTLSSYNPALGRIFRRQLLSKDLKALPGVSLA